MSWADQHCHLPADPTEAQELADEARNAGVDTLVNIGTDVANSAQALKTARHLNDHTLATNNKRHVWATAGVHPHDAAGGIDNLEDLITSAGSELVAVGETGLDYHYDHSPRDVQRTMFARQIDIAQRHNLAPVVHTRSAWDDTFNMFEQEGMPERTVIHCFTGGPDEAQGCLEIGALLSFSGIITFPKAPEVREAAALCPLNRLMVETDSPFLAPVPHRGKPNRPAHVRIVGEAVAEAKKLDPDEVEATTWATTRNFYRMDIDDIDDDDDNNDTAATDDDNDDAG